MKLIFKTFVIFISSYLCVFLSPKVNIEQLLFDDLRFFSIIDPYNVAHGFIFVSIMVTFLTILINRIFKPFIEIYLMYYFKFSFFLLTNFFSISAIFILLRVYGYSRLNVLLYTLSLSIFFYFEDKVL